MNDNITHRHYLEKLIKIINHICPYYYYFNHNGLNVLRTNNFIPNFNMFPYNYFIDNNENLGIFIIRNLINLTEIIL